MNRFQIFAEPVEGKSIVYVYRTKAANGKSSPLAFVTQNERTSQKSANSTSTKDGSVRTPGTDSTEITSTSLIAKTDKYLGYLQDAYDNDELIEVWEIDTSKPDDKNSGKFESWYMRGYITEVKITSKSDDFAQIELTIGISGGKVKGLATLTQEQQEVAALVFVDTTAPASTPAA